MNQDRCCSIAPYFAVHDGKLDAFRELCQRFVAAARTEPKCMYYGFVFDGDKVMCREGYEDAEGVLAHLDHVGALLQESFTLADLTRLEIHGPADELAKLKEPLAHLDIQYYVLEVGVRR